MGGGAGNGGWGAAEVVHVGVTVGPSGVLGWLPQATRLSQPCKQPWWAGVFTPGKRADTINWGSGPPQGESLWEEPGW